MGRCITELRGGVLDVVVLIAVEDTAIPGGLVVRKPGVAVVAKGLGTRLAGAALAALCRFGILLSEAIEPVTSSTRATRRRTLPRAAVELVPKPKVGKPATFMKSVVIRPVALSWIVDAP